MCTVLAAAFLLGPASRVATVVLFGLISFWALREFITLTPTRPGDHRTLFWVFFLFTPLQYVLVGLGMEYYGLLQHLDPGLRLPVHPRADRVGRRLQAVPGAHGQDPGRAADLRLLPELRAGAAEPEASRSYEAAEPAAAVLLRADRAAERRRCNTPGASCSGKHVIAPHDQPQPDLGRLLGRHGQRHADRHGAVVGHAVQALGGRRHVAGHRR